MIRHIFQLAKQGLLSAKRSLTKGAKDFIPGLPSAANSKRALLLGTSSLTLLYGINNTRRGISKKGDDVENFNNMASGLASLATTGFNVSSALLLRNPSALRTSLGVAAGVASVVIDPMKQTESKSKGMSEEEKHMNKFINELRAEELNKLWKK